MKELNCNKDHTIKALNFIEQQLEKEALLYKKHLSYAHLCYDNELKSICYASSKRHKENFNSLLTYLDT